MSSLAGAYWTKKYWAEGPGAIGPMAVVDVAGGWPWQSMALAEDVPGGKWLKIGFADCLIRNCRGRQG